MLEPNSTDVTSGALVGFVGETTSVPVKQLVVNRYAKNFQVNILLSSIKVIAFLRFFAYCVRGGIALSTPPRTDIVINRIPFV